MITPEQEQILRLFFSDDEANRALALTLSEGLNINWEPFRYQVQQDLFFLRGYYQALPTAAQNLKAMLHLPIMHRIRHRCSSYSLASLSPSFWLLQQKHLSVIEADNSPLTSFPVEWQYLSGVWLLSLRQTGLKRLPDWLDRWQSLRYLYLSHNELTEFPEAIFRLQNLEVLVLDGNAFEMLPEEGWERLTKLNWLSISDIPLRALPKGLRHCKRLRYLNINGCQLEELPAWLGDLPLETLSAERNRLRGLPIFAKPWTLECLFLGFNPYFDLSSLQNIFGTNKVYKLRRLGLEGCSIRYIPEWLEPASDRFPILTYLWLSFNPLDAEQINSVLHKWTINWDNPRMRLDCLALQQCGLDYLNEAFLRWLDKHGGYRTYVSQNPLRQVPSKAVEAQWKKERRL